MRSTDSVISVKYILLFLLMTVGPSFAGDSPTQDEIDRRAEADGSLLAMAQFCNISDDRIRSLASKLEQDTLLAAKGQPYDFNSDIYRQLAIAGVRSTQQLLGLVPSSGPGYDSNCKEVQEKVSAALGY